MASSSADWVLGGVRLISSASTTLPNIGPGENDQRGRPVVSSSSMMSVPVMSAGIRSGVNWMRLKTSPSVWAMVRTISVLAVPGRPVIRQCPPTSSAVRTWSSTSSWPTITWPTCARISPRTVLNRSTRAASALASRLEMSVCVMRILFAGY